MKFTKVLALFIAIIMLLSMVVSVGAASGQDTIYDNHYPNDRTKGATARYTLLYYSNANCVRATNTVHYNHSIIPQYNLPSSIKLTVNFGTGYYENTTEQYMTTVTSHHCQDYYLPSGRVLTSATAEYTVNIENDLYANSNYTTVEDTLTITYP